MTTTTLKKETLFGGFLQFIIMVKKHDGRQTGCWRRSLEFYIQISRQSEPLTLASASETSEPSHTHSNKPNLSRVQLPMGQKVDSSQEAKSHTKSEIVISWFLWIQTVYTRKMSCFLVLHSRCKLYWGAGSTFCEPRFTCYYLLASLYVKDVQRQVFIPAYIFQVELLV